MKRILSILALLGAISLQAQEFGISAGYLSAQAKASSGGLSISASEGGFFAGLTADFAVSERFHIQPEVQYIGVDDGNGLLIPVIGKYYIDDKFSLQFGPQLMVDLDGAGPDISAVNLDLAMGLGFDLSQDMSVMARYSLQVNNSYTGPQDLTARLNFIQVGLNYRF